MNSSCCLTLLFFPLLLLFSLPQTGAVQDDFYKDCDLTLGAEVSVFGRRVLISDCDDFTKDYYRTKYGIGKCHQHIATVNEITDQKAK